MSGSVLITGGTGTFGRAFIRRALTQPWSRVISYSRDEMKASALTDEFGHAAPFKAFLGDVRDRERLAVALRGVDTVIHAAALKRVDQGAYSPSEILKTNITGTCNVVDEAIRAGVRHVVVISSDKAVHPTNIYGATKYCAETYAIQANSYAASTGTRIAAVRYGNVLGSRGSVPHIWRRQLAAGQPMTLTDPRMTRFVMTIEQAVALVQTALDHMQGGEVFVPILPSATMRDLAAAVFQRMYRETAFNGEQYLRVTGLRPGGEKLAESLLNEEEPVRTRRVSSDRHPRDYYIVTPSCHDWTSKSWDDTGTAVDPSLTYRSDVNDLWLTPSDLLLLLDSTEAMR